MFSRMIRGTLVHQWKKMILIALTIALGASLATAMLSTVMGISDKINQELKTYGANITVVPEQSSILTDLYEVEGGDVTASAAYLDEDEILNIKTIFWTYNIVDFTPLLSSNVTMADGTEAVLVGSWFNHFLDLQVGQSYTGLEALRSWWDITEGSWLDESDSACADSCMVGTDLAKEKGISVGDTISLTGAAGERELTVAGIYSCDGTEDGQIYAQLDTVQAIAGLEGCVDSVDVSALTAPDDEMAIKAAKNPEKLTVKQYEVWYCTAYVSSICYQIQQAIPGCVASAVRQVADSEGSILDKTQLLMIMITVMALIGSALGISNLVTASVMERSGEIGLMKAIGAQNRSVTGLVLTEILITAIIGGIVGFFAGIGFAQIIGWTVFSSAIEIPTMVIPIVALAVIAVTLLGSIPAIRMLLKLEPAAVLHAAR